MPSAKPFVHLHLHTDYSLLDSSVRVKDAVKKAAKLGMPALALTDHGVMHGAITFYKACQAENINPIVGCEVYTCKDRHLKSREAGPMDHLLLLATSEEGYHNLARIVSIGQMEGFYYKPRVDLEVLDRYHGGLIATSCCERGSIPKAITDDLGDEAERLAGLYRDLFGKDNFYLELEDHGKESEKKICRELIGMSRRMGIPLVATNDVHYIDRSHAEAHEILLCLQMQTVMRDERRLKFASDQYYFKTQDEMWDLFGNEAPEALYNTLEISDRCKVHIKLDTEAGIHFPNYNVPEGFDQDSYLAHLAAEGIRRLYDGSDITNPRSDREKVLAARFQMEFGVIKKTGFVNYFLVVWDFIAHAKKTGVPVGPGRGSGAGSLVAYALGITAIDPLRFDLIFERFLNPERVSPPDFDIDFCQTRRGEIIDYVKDKYGQENCAQIATFGTLGAKTIIRDIGRVLEVPLSECDKLAKMIPDDVGITLQKAEETNPEFKAALATDPNAKQIMRHARILEGLHRNQGTHAAGVVMGEKPLMDILPLCRDKEGAPVAQYEMKPLEMTGLLKMDFLGLKTLTVVQEAVENVRITHGIELDVLNLPLDDAKTFELLNRGDTVGVFQVESKGMRDMLRQVKADRIEDLIALIALYRPGPMDMIPDYTRRKHGEVAVEYPHPLLEGVLKETYGVFIYQEQVQKAANVLAGFSLASGDLLRRAMGKKDARIMEEQRQKFIQGCFEVNKISEKDAGQIFDTIEKFASYGFNKSHSAAYAIISFQTAYLKAHYPAEFMAALLSCEMGNAEKLTGFIAATREMGMEVLPPNVRQSTNRFRPENGNIRFGLAGIKGVGSGAVDALVAERTKNGAYKGFMDFCIRVNTREVNKKCVESLIKAGAFDWTDISRARLFSNLDFALQRAEGTRGDREKGQTNLFDLLDIGKSEKGDTDDDLPAHPPWPSSEMLSYEKELLGFYISGHPLEEYAWEIKHYATHDVPALADLAPGTPVRLGGLITDYVKRFTKKDQKPMGLFRLEGLDGGMPAVLFAEGFQRWGKDLANDMPVMVAGEYRLRENDAQIEVQELVHLSQAPGWYAKQVYLHLTQAQADPERVARLRRICEDHKGTAPLVVCLEFPAGQRVYLDSDSTFRVNASHAFVRAIGQEIGEERVYVQVIGDVVKHPLPKRSFRREG